MSGQIFSTLESIDTQTGLEIDPRLQPWFPDQVATSTSEHTETDLQAVPVEYGERKLFGLRKKVFICIIIIALLLISCAIIGGAIGGTLSKRNSQKASTSTNETTSASSPSIPTPTSNYDRLLQNSSISSLNWTDGTYQHYAVFYQKSSDHISASVWDEYNRTWSTSDISGFNLPAPNSGTSIASSVRSTPATKYFQLNVYFYTADTKVVELYTQSQQALTGSWNNGQLTSTPFVGLPDSHLAAYWDNCDFQPCHSSPIVLYQSFDENLRSTNSSQGWSKDESQIIERNIVAPKTSVALMPWPKNKEFKAYVRVKSSNQVQEYTNKYENNINISNWGLQSGFGTPADGSVLPNPSKIAAIPLTAITGGMEIYVVSLNTDQQLQSMRNIGSKWPGRNLPNLSQTVGNFTDIAMNHDRRFYGISDGKIHEYMITENPDLWNYLGVVNTTRT
ncbi:hypothetical protein HYFRA_00010798 [Hymenoscyphus fraxineus]|uniref:Fucose-specific lectin n=1 Tax=Hymenoscyphus fraxineus TaxID=746836 RepID=A0A9N9L5H2_9HELO|nr:hypothetical protein HYFRA_00010798 [Hymenoscyphus fraxineus]